MSFLVTVCQAICAALELLAPTSMTTACLYTPVKRKQDLARVLRSMSVTGVLVLHVGI